MDANHSLDYQLEGVSANVEHARDYFAIFLERDGQMF